MKLKYILISSGTAIIAFFGIKKLLNKDDDNPEGINVGSPVHNISTENSVKENDHRFKINELNKKINNVIDSIKIPEYFPPITTLPKTDKSVQQTKKVTKVEQKKPIIKKSVKSVQQTKKVKNVEQKGSMKGEPIPSINESWTIKKRKKEWIFYEHVNGDIVCKDPKKISLEYLRDNILYKRHYIVNINDRYDVMKFLETIIESSANKYYVDYLIKLWKITKKDYDIFININTLTQKNNGI